MNKALVLTVAWLPDGFLDRLVTEFPECEFVPALEPRVLDRNLPRAAAAYGLPPVARLGDAGQLRWVQLISAGVPRELCPAARARHLTVTNLAGLYGVTIAQHTFAMLLSLARNLHTAARNQFQRRWDRGVARAMTDLQGLTLAVVGLGNIGREVARLGRAFGMRVVGCRRRERPTSGVDRLYPLAELHAMLAEADVVAVTAPLTAATEGMLGPAEFAALKPGAIYLNVSRGGVAREAALLAALDSGQVAAAGLDAFATEPLRPDHSLWDYPQVMISPHYSGEIVNNSTAPAERFARNLRAWLAGREMEGVVDLEWGY